MFFPAIRLVVAYVLDTCILPGTTAGSEILWLYALAWKRHISSFRFAEAILVMVQRHTSVKTGSDHDADV